jgi:chromate transporter
VWLAEEPSGHRRQQSVGDLQSSKPPRDDGGPKSAYAAAIGTILGACVLLGRIAIGDWFTALIAVVSLAARFRWKVSNPLLMAVTAAAGLIAFPPCSSRCG